MHTIVAHLLDGKDVPLWLGLIMPSCLSLAWPTVTIALRLRLYWWPQMPQPTITPAHAQHSLASHGALSSVRISEFILCNCCIRTKVSLQNSPAVLSCWPADAFLSNNDSDSESDSESESKSPCEAKTDQNYLRQAIFVIKRTKPNIPTPPPLGAITGAESSASRVSVWLLLLWDCSEKFFENENRKSASCKSKNNSILQRQGRRLEGLEHTRLGLDLCWGGEGVGERETCPELDTSEYDYIQFRMYFDSSCSCRKHPPPAQHTAH